MPEQFLEDSPDPLSNNINEFGSRSSETPEELKTLQDDDRDAIAAPFEGISQRSKNVSFTIDLAPSTLVNPRSLATNFEPPHSPVSERRALDVLLKVANKGNDFLEIELEDFSIYVDSAHYPNHLRSLHYAATSKSGHSWMYFDGVLCVGNVRQYVRKVPFRELPIGNYGIDNASVGGQIWVRSVRNQKGNIYYRLKTPSLEYKRFYEPFLWVADLGKHFVDFAEWMTDRRETISIHDFKSNFSKWLWRTHSTSSAFRLWSKQLGRPDFRASVVANVEYLYKEVSGVLGYHKTRKLRIFREILSFSEYKPQTTIIGKEVAKTVVTPYIYECFGHMRIGPLLESIVPSSGRDVLPKSPCVPVKSPSFIRSTPGQPTCHKELISSIKEGDVISTSPDTEESGSKWREELSKGSSGDDRWFALVQKIGIRKSGSRFFDVTWLYRPVDTPCGQMRYPWQNELFLSSHCTCEEGTSSNIDEDEVLDVHSVEWLGQPTTKAEFFIRQMYLQKDRRWITLRKEHLRCDHGKKKPCEYKSGDTVLALTTRNDILEPFVVDLIFEEKRKDYARLRRLLRREQTVKSGPPTRPNELVYTEQFIKVRVSAITAKCIVRMFGPDEDILTPYDRAGAANVFYITHKEVVEDGTSRFVPLRLDEQLPFHQGFNPRRQIREKLRGLDLFCGCGNLGRGLEESGVVEMRWVNDMWDRAIHTYMANAKSSSNLHPFLGSVDDLLRRGLEGKFSESVPSPGEVDFISGGSPCPGFSMLTADKETPAQAKNRSLIASFASFIDFYRPKYGLLENVVTIVQGMQGRSEDLFSQLICALVGMGYQAEVMLGMSWNYGAPQKRPRVFLYFAAPDVCLPTSPKPSHSNTDGKGRWVRTKQLGKLRNAESWVIHEDEETAFKFISAREGTSDLPDVGDAQVDICISHPDHRLSAGVTKEVRPQIINIPTFPYGMGFAQAWNQANGVMSEAERQIYPFGTDRVKPNSKGWTRVHPNDVFSTVTTACAFTDSKIGRLLHWQQQRPLTVMEVRRAQGIPDHEVLLGSPKDQWKLVGNAVTRQVSMALGLAFREAWLGSLYGADEATNGEAIPADLDDTLHFTDLEEAYHDGEGDNGDEEDYSDREHYNGGGEGPKIPIIIVDDDSNSEVTRNTARTTPESVLMVAAGRETETPATSTSEGHEDRADAGLKKRPLSQAVVIDQAAKKPRLKPQLSPDPLCMDEIIEISD